MIPERISVFSVFNALFVPDSGLCRRYIRSRGVMEGEEECKVHQFECVVQTSRDIGVQKIGRQG